MDDAEFVERRRSLSTQLAAMLVLMFRQLGSWRDPDVEVFLEQAVPALAAGQEMLGQLTAVYMAEHAAELFGVDVPIPSLNTSEVTGLRVGVGMGEVYTRPFVTLRNALSEGRPLDKAIELGATRLGQIVEMDLQQTYAHAADAAMRKLPQRARPRYWARVLQGEYDCALCIVASTQRYTVGDLNPIHPGCDCTCKPLSAGEDPGQVIAPELLERAHSEMEARAGQSDRGARSPDYRKHLIQRMTGRNSEVGTMLRWPGDHFTTSADIP